MPTQPRPTRPSAKPTIAELASRLSLSKGTVSRILNDKGNAYSAETRNRVVAIAEEIGYRANPLARALATGKSGFVALWVQTLETSYHAQVAHAMEAALEEHGYQITVTPFGRFNENRDKYAGTPVGMDGIIAHEIYTDVWPLLFRDVSQSMAVVTTGIFAPEQSRDHVKVDLAPATAEAARHLVATGRRRIAYAADDMPTRPRDKRFLAFKGVLADSGIEIELIGLPGGGRGTARTFLRSYFQERGCPGALFCHNDDVALAAYRALIDVGLKVPDDCALVGCDGIPDTEYLPTPITTIVQPFAAMSETASRFLGRRLAEPDAEPQHATLTATLSIRESSTVSRVAVNPAGLP